MRYGFQIKEVVMLIPSHPILIAVEGIDGAGKTTQVNMLRGALEHAGLPVIAAKEPTSSQWGRIIKESANTRRLSPGDELDLFIKDRSDHVETVIGPRLGDGKIVLLDGYFYSTIAYQGSRGTTVSEVKSMMEDRFPLPDAVFILDIDADLSAYRVTHVRGEDPNHFEPEGSLSMAREIFNSLVGANIFRIDGAMSREAVHREIVTKFIEGPLRANWFRLQRELTPVLDRECNRTGTRRHNLTATLTSQEQRLSRVE
jgi:dTMP kinase